MNLEKRALSRILEAEMIGASALMAVKERLEYEEVDYIRGFLQGYYHCMKLSEKLDDLNCKENK